MSTKTHYFRIGVFVVISVALILAGIIIFGASELIPRKQFIVETYLDDSVQGLSVGSPVKMQGVPIGGVEEIAFVERKYEIAEEHQIKYSATILIRMAIYLDDVPGADVANAERAASLQKMVDAGMRIRLASAGITGQKYIAVELLEPESFPPMKIVWQPTELYVPSAPGVFDKIMETITKVSKRMDDIDIKPMVTDAQALIHDLRDQVEGLDLPEMEAKINGLLDDTRGVIKGPEITETLANLRSASAKTDKLLTDLDGILNGDEVQKTLANIEEITEDIRNRVPGAMDRLELTVAGLGDRLRGQQDEIGTAIHDLRMTLQNLRELSDLAKRYPASLLWGTEPPAADPGGK